MDAHPMTSCFTCKEKLSSTRDAVILHCDCPEVLCHQCARQQLRQRGNSDLCSLIECPKCLKMLPAVEDSGSFLAGLTKAMAEENSFLKKACKYLRICPTAKADWNLEQYKGSSNSSLLQLYQKLASLYKLNDSAAFEFFRKVSILLESEESLRNLVICAEMRRESKSESSEPLPLTPVQKLSHPQIQPESIARAMRSQQNKIHEEEVMAQDDSDWYDSSIAFDPYALLEFHSDNVLQKFIRSNFDVETKDIDLACILCQENIKIGESVFQSCRCPAGICLDCARGVIAQSEGTYHVEHIGIKCCSCRAKTFFAVSNAAVAQELEKDLIEIAEKSYHEEKKHNQSQIDYYVDFYNKVAEPFVASHGEVNKKYNFVHTFEEEELYRWRVSKKYHVIKCMIARLQAHKMALDEKNETKDLLHLGPLVHLKIQNNSTLEYIVRHRKQEINDEISQEEQIIINKKLHEYQKIIRDLREQRENNDREVVKRMKMCRL